LNTVSNNRHSIIFEDLREFFSGIIRAFYDSFFRTTEIESLDGTMKNFGRGEVKRGRLRAAAVEGGSGGEEFGVGGEWGSVEGAL
jgi:hypothetical protein